MPQSDDARLAVIEQILRDMRTDVEELRTFRREDHHRLRNVEEAVLVMTKVAAEVQISTAGRQRKIELRLQLLTVVIAVAALATPFLYQLAHH